MRSAIQIPLLILGFAALPDAGLRSQGFLLTRTDGRQLQGDPTGLQGTGGAQALQFRTPTGTVAVPVGQILALHGAPPRVDAPVAIYLGGGDELKGEVVGGDELGDHLLVKSVALGNRKVPVDRLASLVFRARSVGAGRDAFVLGADANCDEALFRKARRGFDRIPGELDRFQGDGVMFADAGRSVPRLFRYETLSALSIRGGAPPRQAGDWLLVTVTGDRLRVAVGRVRPTSVDVVTEFGAVTLPLPRVAALTRLVGDRVFVSDLEPARIEEAGNDGAVGQAALFTYRRDRTVSGGLVTTQRAPADGFLVAAGRTYGKGLGVHSRCVLTYRVPAGMTRFLARVAIDDEVGLLGVKGDVDVAVRLGSEALFQKDGLRRGQPPAFTGVLRVEPGKLLTLEVGFGKGLFLGDRVDWLTAVFLK